eukprot:356599-Chlamydomonas_euryale.AAC.6
MKGTVTEACETRSHVWEDRCGVQSVVCGSLFWCARWRMIWVIWQKGGRLVDGRSVAGCLMARFRFGAVLLSGLFAWRSGMSGGQAIPDPSFKCLGGVADIPSSRFERLNVQTFHILALQQTAARPAAQKMSVVGGVL